MILSADQRNIFTSFIPFGWRPVLFAALLLLFFLTLIAEAQISTNAEENTITVGSAPDTDIISYAKTVTVKQEAKSVLAFGADVTIEGRVEEDVAVIGGSVIQKEGSFIGGDLIIVGGKYRPDIANPLRTEGRQTIIIAGYEDELKELVQNPSEIFAPSFSLTFFGLRVLALLFWFLVSMAFATIAPGAVSRAITRLRLSSLKVVGIGFFSLLFVTICLIGGAKVLPGVVMAILGLMVLVLLLLAYIFGRVALNVSFGKLLQKHLLSEKNQSETLAIFIGVVIWTVLLSIPYLWAFALLALFSAGIGLVLTARTPNTWKKSR